MTLSFLIVLKIREKVIELIIIAQSIATSTPAGSLYLNILGALSQKEREWIKEWVKAGLASARKRGRIGAKPRVSQDKFDVVSHELSEGRTYTDVAKIIEVHLQTLYRLVPVKLSVSDL